MASETAGTRATRVQYCVTAQRITSSAVRKWLIKT